jgi:hypothetical protein
VELELEALELLPEEEGLTGGGGTCDIHTCNPFTCHHDTAVIIPPY